MQTTTPITKKPTLTEIEDLDRSSIIPCMMKKVRLCPTALYRKLTPTQKSQMNG